MEARTPAARPVEERGGLVLGPVLDEPTVHTGAVDPAAAGRLGDGIPLGHQQQCLEAAIHTGLTGAGKRCGQPLAIRLVEPRPGRVIMSLHASREHLPRSHCKAYGDLISTCSSSSLRQLKRGPMIG
jgi:hypothetical protein